MTLAYPDTDLRQAQRLGRHVRQGERATPVGYWKWRTPEEPAQRPAQTGKEDPAPCTPFVSAVFNFDQVEGVARPADDLPPRPEDHRMPAQRASPVAVDSTIRLFGLPTQGTSFVRRRAASEAPRKAGCGAIGSHAAASRRSRRTGCTAFRRTGPRTACGILIGTNRPAVVGPGFSAAP